MSDEIQELQAAADKAADEVREAFAAAEQKEEERGGGHYETHQAYVKAARLGKEAAAAMRRLVSALPD